MGCPGFRYRKRALGTGRYTLMVTRFSWSRFLIHVTMSCPGRQYRKRAFDSFRYTLMVTCFSCGFYRFTISHFAFLPSVHYLDVNRISPPIINCFAVNMERHGRAVESLRVNGTDNGDFHLTALATYLGGACGSFGDL